jgi:F-type H+-transporting ATPase subunit delta
MRENNDLDLVKDVAHQYKTLVDQDDKTVSVTVTTAVPMDDKLRGEVRAKMEKDLKAPIYLVERVDPSIIGGIVIEERGNRYDASVKAQLVNIRKKLSTSFLGGEE